MIELRSVTKTYLAGSDAQVTAVRGLDLRVEEGEFVVITGRSGSGKTTLLNLVAGLTRPTSGLVSIDGVDLWRLSDRGQARLRNRKFGFVFQFPSLLPSLTVMQNLLLPTSFEGSNRDAGEQARERAKWLLETVGLSARQEAYPRHLSAGQQQRVVIARALMMQPEIVLADEPTSNLDEQTEQETMDLFRDIHVSQGLTILLVTHTTQLLRYGTRSLAMAQGAFVEAAATQTPQGSNA
jgi:ABC-type lipoprotein export system ATPase subunit